MDMRNWELFDRAEYFGWNEKVKAENSEVINSWWKEQQELNISI